MKTIYTIIFLCYSFSIVNAQILITDQPGRVLNQNAILELNSTNSKGILLPFVDLSSKISSDPLPAHIEGMMVYNTTTQISDNLINSIFPGIYYNDGATWQKLEIDQFTIGDLRITPQLFSEDGWYPLNGQPLSELPTVARENAINLGFTDNLPNSHNLYLKGKNSTEKLGDIVGNQYETLTVANLPNVTLNGRTTQTGNHNHPFVARGSTTVTSIEGGVSRTIKDNISASDTTNSTGNHTHTYTANTGGQSEPIEIDPSYIGTRISIYLGQ